MKPSLLPRLFLILTLALSGLPLLAQDDASDPYIIAQATQLGNNPTNIFNFVRDQIGWEIYAGSVRGARGTLWTKSGNSLDRASLLAALLKAAGQPVRYVQGRLGYQDAISVELINRLFPFRSRVIGCLSPTSFSSNPIFDGRFANDVLDYWWVEYGAAFTPLDPNRSTNGVGQAPVAVQTRYAAIPENLRQKVTLRLKAETYPLANGLFKLGTNTATVLSKTYFVSDLVGRPLSVGQFVNATGLGSLVFTTATFTYTPYIFLGTGAADISQDQVTTGDNFQELYTNFPVGSTVMTGLFLEIDAQDETNTLRTYTRTIYDRLGKAARLGLVPTDVSIAGTPSPVLTDFDITTVNVLAGLEYLPAFANQQARLSAALAAYTAIKSQVAAIPTTGELSAVQQNLIQQAVTLQRNIVIAQNELITMGFNGGSDAYLSQLQKGYGVQASYNSPRLTLAVASFADGEASFRLDVLKNNIRYAGIYGQNRNYSVYADVNRGLIESHLESAILAQVTGRPAIGISEIFAALGDPAKLTVISSANLKTLESTTLTANAKAFITEAVQAGRIVLTPRQMVTVQGKTTVGWLETDATGRTISVFEDGGHQAIASYAGVQVSATKYNQKVAQFIGRVEGIGAAGIAFTAGILNGVATLTSYAQVLKSGKEAVAGVSTAAPDTVNEFWKKTTEVLEKLKLELPAPVEQGFSLIDSYASGLKEGIEFAQKFLKANLPLDPEVLPFLGSTLEADITGTAPGANAGVQTSITPDTLFTQGIGGLQLPILYRGRITNTGPTTDTFRLQGAPNASYNVFTGLDGIVIPAGKTVEVSVCVRPWDSLLFGPVGTAMPVGFTATSVTNNNITSTATTSFSQPAVAGLQLSVDPPVLVATPGASIPARVTLAATGNAATGLVNLLSSVPAGVQLSGLTSPVNLPVFTTNTQNITINVPSGTALGTTLKIGLAANYTAGGAPQSVLFTLPVTVVGAGQCALEAATNARSISRANFATLLNQLALDMNQALANPGSEVDRRQVVSTMTSILNDQMSAPFLAPLVAGLTTATQGVAASNPATIATALSSLNGSLCNLRDTLATASNFSTRIFLTPSTQTTGPNLPVTYTIVLANDGPQLRQYDLSVVGVPNGVTASFSTPTVTLGPAGSTFSTTFSPTLTLTPGASLVAPFDFTVVATPRGAPAYARSAPGALLVRNELLSVDGLVVTPTAASVGGSITVAGRVFSAVNQARPVRFSFVIENSVGAVITFPSQSTVVQLTTQSSLQTFTIPAYTLPTQITNGVYRILMTGYDESGTPIYGAQARTPFIVGAPLSAQWTTVPSTTVPGSSIVEARLNLTRETLPNPISTLVGTTSVVGVPKSMVLHQNGQQRLAYVCADTAVNIVDVTNEATPTLLSSFGANVLGPIGYRGVGCGITGSTLVVSYSRENGNNTADIIPTNFASFNLANPLSPSLIGQSNLPRPDLFSFTVAGSTAFGGNSTVLYNPFSGFIFQQYGDVVALNLSQAPTNGTVTLASSLFPPPAGDGNRGGPRTIRALVPVSATRLYAASSSSEGGNLQTPGNPPFNGQLVVVDTSNPAVLSLVRRVDVPGTAFLTGVAVQGNTAIAVGDSTGVYDINSGFTGTVVIASFDITDVSNPILRNTVVTQLKSKNGAGIVALTNNTFAIGGTEVGTNQPVLVLLDATNRDALRYVPYSATFSSTPVLASGDLFYSLGTSELGIFRLSSVNGPQISVTLRLPKNSNTSLVANSFNQTPSAVTTGTTFDTYRWDQPSLDTIRFSMSLTGMNAGDVRRIVESGQVNFTLPAFGPGTLELPPLTILTEQIMTITPDQVPVGAGSRVDFTVSLRNPTAQSQTFTIGSLGLPATWFTLPPPITLNAGSSTSFIVGLTPPLNANGSGFGRLFDFAITATAQSGITGSAATRVYLLDGGNTGADATPNVLGITGTATPANLTIGRGGSGNVEVSILNTGNVATSVFVDVFAMPLPAGWTVSSSPSNLIVLPGGANTKVALVTFRVPANAPSGTTQFSLPLRYNFSTATVPLSVTVTPNGVSISINPQTGGPGTIYQATVTNTGSVSDTFALAPVGPLAENTGLNGSSVTLAAGASQTFNLVVSNVALNLPGAYPVQLRATSQAVPGVTQVGSASLIVPAARGVVATLTPGSQQVNTTPRDVTLNLGVTATGNLNDLYSAVITGTSGPVTASLSGPGSSGSAIPSFALPALGNAAFPAPARLNATGTGTVTVKVTSLSDPTVFATTTASIQSPTPQLPPTVSAGPNRVVPLNRLAILDGSGTSDPNTPALPINYNWQLQSAPQGSNVAINFNTQARASFRPDLPGAYVFQLTASNTAGPASSTVTITAQNQAPVAIVSPKQFAPVGSIAWLNGVDSFDPDGGSIQYQWQLISAPQGSSAQLRNTTAARAWLKPDVAGQYQIQLTVTDGSLLSQPQVILLSTANAPNVSAGVDREGRTGSTVALRGVASAASPLTLAWTFVSVPAGSTLTNAAISGAATLNASFTPDVAGDYMVQLRGSDGTTNTDSTVKVTVNTFNAPPVVGAAVGPFFAPNQNVQVNTSSTTDPDNGPGTLGQLSWFSSTPAGSTAVLQNGAFVPNQPGFHVVRIAANDRLSEGFANVWTTVANACDADANGTISTLDLELIQAALGQAVVAGDPRDGNADLAINAADVTFCTALLPPGDRPQIQAAPTSLTFNSLVGTNPASQNVLISSTGIAFSITASTSAPWLTAIVAGNQITVSVNTTGLAAQTYNARVTVISPTAGNSPFEIPVTLNLAALTPISLGTNPQGLSLLVDGVASGAPVSISRAPGTSLLLEAPLNQTAPQTRYDFKSWSSGAARSHMLNVASSAISLVATYDTLFQLNYTISGSGTVAPASGGYFLSGSQQNLVATPGACALPATFSANAPAGVVTMSSPQNVTITFPANVAQLAPAVKFTFAGDRRITGTNRWRRSYVLQNTGTALTNVVVAIDPPFTNVQSVYVSNGVTQCAVPLGSAYLNVGNLAAGATFNLTVEVVTTQPTAPWTINVRALAGGKP